MKKTNLILAILAACALLFAGCSKGEEAAEKTDEIDVGEVTVNALATSIDKGECTVLDANGTQVRAEYGKIPGAKLLTHYKDYNASELPGDKASKLVFYCSNEQCGASHAAAEKAYLAGYTNVSILPAGIAGWKEAGQKTESVQ